MSRTIPRFLLPRIDAPLSTPRNRALYHQSPFLSSSPSTLPVYRHASTTASKPITLEKPERFNPPSHPARLNRRTPRQYPGPRLSESQQEEQKTKQYPNAFPPQGTWRYWFLTSRWIHICIVLVTSPGLHLSLPPSSNKGFHRFRASA